jgi:hypothetical protein
VKGSGRGASGGEEAAWRDLIANYEAEPEADGGPLPWPSGTWPARGWPGRCRTLARTPIPR